MKKIGILITLLVLAVFSFAQESGKIVKTIKGKVINKETNEEISYTNIGLEGTFYGTASNAEGNFELKIPEDFASKNIYFSAVGYKNLTFPVANLLKKEFNVVKLEAQSYGINDIDIAAQSRVLLRILRMASENIPVNYIGGPLNLEGTYTNEKTTGSQLKKQTAQVLIFDETGYSYPSKLDAFKSRKYKLTKKEDSEESYRFSTGGSNMDELLELDWVRSASSVLNPNLLADFQLKLKDEPKIDGKEFWVISFSQKNPTLAGSNDFYATSFEGEITIGKTDYDVKEISGLVKSAKNNVQGKSLAIATSGKNYFKNVDYTFLVRYKNLNPEIISLNKTYSYNNNKVVEKSEIKINQVDITDLTELKNRDYFIGE